jgi:Cu/Ag efflux protein CusF
MHTIVRVLPLVLALAAPPLALAQHAHDHGSAPKGAAAPAAKGALAEGEVRKVDRVKGTVTLKHGPLEALGMGPMTMQFAAADPKLLANLKEGDKVRFAPEQTRDGKLVVHRIEVIK